CQQESNWPTV
nr:immunoglobulin light chain junction region [Macaca mulatta]MPN94627.1 immunoglobulin light chain junction region [Macaca mulatta]MPN96906.1 immunoglobulin light chain junction region [Macaca mulatta]MPO02347.1 immunoglobulin light chain junction region [Macaca mulatta]